MIVPWRQLGERDRNTFRAVFAFLQKRLEERATVEWALELKSERRVERIAVQDLVGNSPTGRSMRRPWSTAWQLILESWADEFDRNTSIQFHDIQSRLRSGDRSGRIVADIVELVKPRLKVRKIDAAYRVSMGRHPKTVDDLLGAWITSGDLINLTALRLDSIDNVHFLRELANALDAAVERGLDIAQRIDRETGRSSSLRLGLLNSVRYIHYAAREGYQPDIDEHHNGMAPSVKLLHAVVSRITAIESSVALQFVGRWRIADNAIRFRLWAAMAVDPQLVPAVELGEALVKLSDDRFWDRYYVEVSEARAARFGEFNADVQKKLIDRLRRGPPKSSWPKSMQQAEFQEARSQWSERELFRIEEAGGLSKGSTNAIMRGRHRVARIGGTQSGTQSEQFVSDRGGTVKPDPDIRLDVISGRVRLEALEALFAAGSNDPFNRLAKGGVDWLRTGGNVLQVLDDLEADEHSGNRYPQVWDRFGWTHSRTDRPGLPPADIQTEARRVIALLLKLSDETRTGAIAGLSVWIDNWSVEVVASNDGVRVWLLLWPIAVSSTNAGSTGDPEADLGLGEKRPDDRSQPLDLATLNTPAGRLVRAFLAACPDLDSDPDPFHVGSIERQMLDAIGGATGRSGLIARYKLTEHISYCVRADKEWAVRHLVPPLLGDLPESLAMWRAISHRTQAKNALEIIGRAMGERVLDPRLDRETRKGLVFNLLVRALFDMRDEESFTVPPEAITQMLRSVEDEVRASAANTIQRFVAEADREAAKLRDTSELFYAAAQPFLRNIWPKERSLTTAGVSKAFADLPAACGAAFADAVDAVARFLVPFECWSLLDYGLYGEENGIERLSKIDDEVKAAALLRLLDLTISSRDGAVVPHDLTDALDRVRLVSARLENSPEYRRLSTLARR